MSVKQDYISGMCFIIPLNNFRKTPNVGFFIVPEVVKGLSSVDQVRHAPGAVSPSFIGCDNRTPWYMHFHQEDRLLVYSGKRIVRLYSKEHGKIETFEVTPDYVKHGDKIIFDKPSIFGWPVNVFHRVESPEGSISTNFAFHSEGFDIKSNFNIYYLDDKTGEFEVARDGFKDQG